MKENNVNNFKNMFYYMNFFFLFMHSFKQNTYY